MYEKFENMAVKYNQRLKVYEVTTSDKNQYTGRFIRVYKHFVTLINDFGVTMWIPIKSLHDHSKEAV